MTLDEKKDYCVKDDEGNCECLEGGSWIEGRENMCLALGDCGIKTNYLGQSGFNTWDDLFVYEDEDKEEDGDDDE